MWTVRQAVPKDLSAVMEIYDKIIDLFQEQTGTRAWRKGVYPTEAVFQAAIEAGTLYVGELDGALAAGMIITQGTDKTYGDAPWQIAAEDAETAVIHTLGVSPGAAGASALLVISLSGTGSRSLPGMGALGLFFTALR